MYAVYLPWVVVILPFIAIAFFGEFILAIIVAALMYGLMFHLGPMIISGIGNFSENISVLSAEHIFFGIAIVIASLVIGYFYDRRKMLSENDEYMLKVTRDDLSLLDDTDALNKKVKYFSEAQPHKTRIFFWFWFFGKDLTFGNLKWLKKSIENDLRSSSRAGVEAFAEKQKKANS